MKKTASSFLGILCIFVFALSSCTSYGTKIDYDKIEVFYTKNVSAEDAKLLGDFINNFPVDEGERPSLQIDKIGEKYTCRFVMAEPDSIDVETIESFKALGYLIVTEVFVSKDLNILLCDNQFKTIKEITNGEIVKYGEEALDAANFGEKLAYPGGEVYYTNNVTLREAQKLGEYLIYDAFFNPKGNVVSVQIDKENNTYLFKMIAIDGAEDKPELIQLAKVYTSTLSEFVFNSAPVNFYFCDTYFKTKKEIPYFVKE